MQTFVKHVATNVLNIHTANIARNVQRLVRHVQKNVVRWKLNFYYHSIILIKKLINHENHFNLKQMAQKGITEHQKEISEFKEWLSSHK